MPHVRRHGAPEGLVARRVGHIVDRPPEKQPAERVGAAATPGRLRAGPVAVAGLIAFPLILRLGGESTGLWLPALGVGVALLAWTSWWVLPLLTAEILLVGLPPTGHPSLDAI